ncbi:DHA1 family tetracycline resistance protein-like MFS transporter [Pedobacter cryoconitis]|uniref:DHA1 family tetracycline resistance protein-like MFS transporter n=1 Tax=Pedobacter cryoconitis TaxID=188932 RepID=A0A7W9E067_9SPHI|nr:TCR/Tet family MFS transporter [Pedobacter cryoconitis]MBB5638077.1 DHA1 family tetracycline resistance protein-like MFS transporter [Pedobacter cryoconitis]
MASQKKSAIGFIFITLLIDFTGFGIIIPVLPKLIEELTGGGLSLAAVYGGWLTISYSVMQFISSPILGGLSDRFGRRPILLASLFGLGIDYIFLAFAPTIAWLFVGRIFAGITGASFTTAMAYIADVSTPEKRAQNFGLIGAAFGIGFIVGPVIGGVFSQFGLRVPFIISAVLALVNWLYGYFILPESLTEENRRSFDWKRANPVGSLLHIKKYPKLAGLLAALFLLYIAAHAVQSTWNYYTMEKFQWNEAWVGYSLGFVGIVVGIVQGVLIRIIIPKIGQEKAVFYGLLLYFIGFVLFAFATQGWMMFAFMLPYGLAGIFGPAMQGIIANNTEANAQGEIQGVTAGLMSAAAIIGPLMMTNLFAYFTNPKHAVYFPGAPFILAAFLTLIGLFICSAALKKHHS